MRAITVPPATLAGFTGSQDTLRAMVAAVQGPRGERSVVVRRMTENVVRGVQPKDYLGEIVAIRNFVAEMVRYTNDPLHVEWIADPERLMTDIMQHGHAVADCDEIASLIATMCLQVGRVCEFVVVGFSGDPDDYSHVFVRVLEPKSHTWIVCDPVAGTDERGMLERVTNWQTWTLDSPPANSFQGSWAA